MDFSSIGAFILGLVTRFGLILVIPVALALVVALALAVALAVRRAREFCLRIEHLDGARFCATRHYAPNHLWLGGARRLRLGLDDLAARLVPRNAQIQVAAAPGSAVEAGAPLLVVRFGGRSVSWRAPASLVVSRVNPRLGSDPGVLSDAYGAGWLIEFASNDSSWRSLPSGAAAREWFHAEHVGVGHTIEEKLGVAAADGGGPLMLASAGLDDAQREAVLAAIAAKR